MRYRQKPNGMWVVDYDDNGKRKRVSTGIKTAPMKTPPADVKNAGREIILGIRVPQVSASSSAGQARKGDGRMTVSDLLDKCEGSIWHPDNVRSQRTIRSNVGILRALPSRAHDKDDSPVPLGDVALDDLTFTRIEELVKEMKTRGYQPATIKRKLAMLNAALRMATQWTDEKHQPLLRAKPPFPRITVNNLKERIISAEEEAAWFVAAEKRRQLEPNRQWYQFIAFLDALFVTGGRLSESLGLGPHNIVRQQVGDREISFLTFPRYQTKSGKPRTIPLADRAVNAFGRLMDHLVLDRETGAWKFFGVTTSTADVMFRQIREDVMRETGMDVSDVSLHTIRHTVLTRLARGGMDLARLQQWAGHSDPKITAERYLHLIPSDLVAGLAILGTGGTPDDTKARDRTKHVSVPNTLTGANGANAGTARLN